MPESYNNDYFTYLNSYTNLQFYLSRLFIFVFKLMFKIYKVLYLLSRM